MSILKCYLPSCKERPIIACSCSNNILVCETHQTDHFIQSANHKPTSLITEIDNSYKGSILQSIRQRLKTIKQNLIGLFEFTNKIVKTVEEKTNELTKEMMKEKEYLNLMTIWINNRNHVYKEVIDVMRDEKKNGVKLLNFEFDNIRSELSKFYEFKPILPEMVDDDFAIAFDNYYPNAVQKINLTTFESIPMGFNVDTLHEKCGCCKINDNIFFVYGGFGNERLGNARIIDLKCKSIKNLASSTPISLNGLCLYGESVYSFGGYNDLPKKECKKYDLKKNEWKSIQSLPEANLDTSASVLNIKIIVTGSQSSSIFIYNPISNIFSTFQHQFPKFREKFTIRNWIVCFKDCLYEIDEDEQLIRHQNIEESGGNYNSSATFKREKYIYFVLNRSRIFRINTELKSFEIFRYN